MTEFLQMGGYAAYVWPAYGITLLVFVANIWSARRLKALKLEQVRRSMEAEQPVRRATVRQLQ
jgi:heme exporter protein D